MESAPPKAVPPSSKKKASFAARLSQTLNINMFRTKKDALPLPDPSVESGCQSPASRSFAEHGSLSVPLTPSSMTSVTSTASTASLSSSSSTSTFSSVLSSLSPGPGLAARQADYYFFWDVPTDDPSSVKSPRHLKEADAALSVNPVRRAHALRGHYNSTFSLFVDSTAAQLQLVPLLKSLAGLILLEYERDRFRTDVVYQELFDESLHPVVLDPRFDEDPTHETVFQFLKSIFEILRLPVECVLIAGVYMIRIRSNHFVGDVGITSRSWRRITLASMVLATKLWDDLVVWNSDIGGIHQLLPNLLHPKFAATLNELEYTALEHLQFNVNVKRRAFMEAYFNLRAYAVSRNMEFIQVDYSEAAEHFAKHSYKYSRQALRSHGGSAKQASKAGIKRSLSEADATWLRETW